MFINRIFVKTIEDRNECPFLGLRTKIFDFYNRTFVNNEN